MKKHLFFSILIFCLSLTVNAQSFITDWDLSEPGSGANNQISFGVGTSGTATYSWVTVPAASNGSGTFTGPTLTIAGLPANATIRLTINATNFRQIKINNGVDRSRLISVRQWGSVAWWDMQAAFYGCNNLQIAAVGAPDLTGIIDMSLMFKNCSSLNTGNLNAWNTGNVVYMMEMFSGATAFNRPIGNWNVSNVENMSYMFSGASAFNQPIETWFPAKVENMSFMFQNATSFNQSLNNWDTKLINVTNMNSMFRGATSFNGNIFNWNVANVTNMNQMFHGATAFNQDISTWNVGNVTNMNLMFSNATAFNQDISAWDVASVTNMTSMFNGATSFNQNIGLWNVGNVTTMASMFKDATSFNQDLSAWDITGVTNMRDMFNGATNFNQSLAAWATKFSPSPNLQNFLDNSGLSVANYDATLIAFDSFAPNNFYMTAANLQYCIAAPQRANLVDPGQKNWTILGDSPISPTIPIFDNVPLIICLGDDVTPLPTVSDNSITGTWSPSVLSSITSGVYTFTPTVGQCATMATLSITVNQPLTPTFNGVPTSICVGAIVPNLPTTSDNGAQGLWLLGDNLFSPLLSPPIVNNTVTTTYTFRPSGCFTSFTLTVTVNPQTTPTFALISPICEGTIAPTLTTTSTNGITGLWSPSLINTLTSGVYTFTPNLGQCAATATMPVIVNLPTIPLFASIPPICEGTIAPTLTTTSTNGITGLWSPSTISTLTSGVYTFTPNLGQCAATATMPIIVNPPNTIPLFNPIPAICEGTIAPTLTTTSTNGIMGLWSPSPINTLTSGVYTFTPDGGQCATTATMPVIVNPPNIIPLFNPIPAICEGTIAPILTTTSTNGITGLWSPSPINTLTSGVYTFTPDGGQCAATATLPVIVSPPNTIPLFNPISAICEGDPAPNLTTTSINTITGTWSPSTVSTLSSDVYTFTPNPGQCATLATLTVTVNPNLLPSFTAVAPICQGATLTNLPTLSTNGFTGIWNPTINNTLTTNYTFTPDAGQCATLATLTVTVNPNLLPSFTAVAPICEGGALAALPTVSANGFTGVWSPTINNTLTTNYTFTPDAGQCATLATLTVTVNPNLLPSFTAVAPICEGGALAALPTVSTNGFTGTWNPVLDNTKTTTYSFTPNSGQCATLASLVVTVTTKTIPEFTAIAPICQGAFLADLPLVSTNVISGTWAPAIDNTKTTTYVFTPITNQCATTTTLAVNVFDYPEVELGADLYVSTGEKVTLTALTDSVVAWFPTGILNCTDCMQPMFVADSTLMFYVESANSIGCKTIDSVTVFVDKATYLYIPNSFSPNGSGYNDIFNAVTYKKLNYTMQVYDRWGNLIYEWTDQEVGWDGTYKGQNSPQGIYVYVFQATENYKPIKLEGTVTLIR